MKKKIKNLTMEDVKNICHIYTNNIKCKGCPFEERDFCIEIWRYTKMKKSVEQFEKENDCEQEIEVEDSE